MLEIFTDSDWASHKATRKSVSACCLFFHGCLLHSSSRSQRVIALSSAEAELYSAVSACCDALLLKVCLCFALSLETLVLKLYIDNSAAKQILKRQGVGKVRHLSTRALWVQGYVKEGIVQVNSIPTKWNVSDIGTKRLHCDRMKLLMHLCGSFDQESNDLIGQDVYDNTLECEVVSHEIKQIRKCGFNSVSAKRILHIALVMSALGQPVGAGDTCSALDDAAACTGLEISGDGSSLFWPGICA